MNVLIISPMLYPCAIGGLEIFNYNFSRGLAERGINVYILTACKYDYTDKKISRINLNTKVLLNRTLSICFHMLFNLMKLRKKIDIIYVPYTSNSSLVYPILIAKKFFTIPPYLISIHGGGMYHWKPQIVHRLFFKYAEYIIAVSKTIKNEYEKRCGRRIEVIPPVIPFHESEYPREKIRAKYKLGIKDMVILFAGTLKEIKGCDILLDAFSSLGKEYLEENNLKLLYVGEGPMKPILIETVYQKGFDKYVKFVGSVLHEKVSDIFKMSDIYVIPSLFEGTPLALLEAMFNGLPIIGTDTNGINNIICNGRNGLLFKKKDIASLKEKIKILVEDRDLRIRLGKSAEKDYLESYDFNQTIDKHIELFSDIIQNVSYK